MTSTIIWWSILIVQISPEGIIEKEWEYRRYPESQRWQCEARASVMTEQGKKEGFYGVCVLTSKIGNSNHAERKVP